MMLEATRISSSSVDPHTLQKVQEDFVSYKQQYEELRFDEALVDHIKFIDGFYIEIAKSMGEIAQLDFEDYEKASGLRQKFKTLVKRVLRKFMRPLFKVTFTQQQEINRHTLLLAQAVATLEGRVASLERQLKSMPKAH